MADNSSWIQYFDEETGAPYLYNEDTGESRWIIPDEQYDTYSQQQYDQPDYQSEYLTNDYNGAATYDQNYGYYGNYGNNNYENQQNYDPVTTELWEEYFDDFGNPYYYNNVTGESRWDVPTDTNQQGYDYGEDCDEYGNFMGGQSARSNRSLRSKGSSKKIVIVPGSAKSRTSFSEAWGGTGMGSFRNNMSGKDFNNLAFASSQDNQSLQSATKKEGKAVRLPNGEIVRLNMPLVKRHSTIKNTASSQQPAALPATPASAKNMSPLSNINTSGIDMESVRRTPSGSPPQKQNSFREFSNIPMSRTTSFSSKQQPPPPTSAPPSRQASFSGASIKLGASISRNPSFSGKQQPPPPSGSPTHASLSRQQSTSGKSAFFQDNESISSVSNKRPKNPFDQMKVGAKIKRKQIDYADAKNEIWLEWQAPNNGPTFYAKDGAEGGQWKKPKIFEILDSVQTKESPKAKDSPIRNSEALKMTKSDLDLFASPDFSAFKTVPRTPSRAYLATQGKMLPTTKEISTGEENKSEKSTVSAINLPNKESEKSIEPINLKVHTSTKSSQSIDSNNSSRKQTPVSATHKATALDPKDQIVTEIVSSVVNPQPVETLEERERRLKQEYVDMKIKDIQLEAQLELQRLKEKADEAKAKWDRIGGGNPLMTPEGLNTINTKIDLLENIIDQSPAVSPKRQQENKEADSHKYDKVVALPNESDSDNDSHEELQVLVPRDGSHKTSISGIHTNTSNDNIYKKPSRAEMKQFIIKLDENLNSGSKDIVDLGKVPDVIVVDTAQTGLLLSSNDEVIKSAPPNILNEASTCENQNVAVSEESTQVKSDSSEGVPSYLRTEESNLDIQNSANSASSGNQEASAIANDDSIAISTVGKTLDNLDLPGVQEESKSSGINVREEVIITTHVGREIEKDSTKALNMTRFSVNEEEKSSSDPLFESKDNKGSIDAVEPVAIDTIHTNIDTHVSIPPPQSSEEPIYINDIRFEKLAADAKVLGSKPPWKLLYNNPGKIRFYYNIETKQYQFETPAVFLEGRHTTKEKYTREKENEMLLAMKLMKGESDQVISDIQVSVDAERISDIIPGGIQHIIQENQDDTVEAILLKSGETPLEMVSRFKKELYQKRAYGQRLTSQSLDATPNAGYKATWMSQLPVDEDIALPTFLTPIPKSEVVAGTMDSIQFEQTPAVYDPSPNTVVANRSKPNKGEQKDGLHVLRTMDDVFDDYAKPSGLDESLLRKELLTADRYNRSLRNYALADSHEEDSYELLDRLSRISIDENFRKTFQQMDIHDTLNNNSTNNITLDNIHTFMTSYRNRETSKSITSQLDPREEMNHVRSQIEKMCGLLDSIETSPIETIVNEMHLLNAIIYQRSKLLLPRGLLRDKSCHSSLPMHSCCPQMLSEINPDVYDFIEENESCQRYQCNYNNSYIYRVNGKTASRIQPGAPFDYRMKNKGIGSFHREKWSEYKVNVARTQKFMEYNDIELLCERDTLSAVGPTPGSGGYLFYCPHRNCYSSDGVFAIIKEKITSNQGNPTGDDGNVLRNKAKDVLLGNGRPELRGDNGFVHRERLAHTFTTAKTMEQTRKERKSLWDNLLGLPDSDSISAREEDVSFRKKYDSPALKSSMKSPNKSAKPKGKVFLLETINIDNPSNNEMKIEDYAQIDNYSILKSAFAFADDTVKDATNEFISPHFDIEAIYEIIKGKEKKDPNRALEYEVQMDEDSYATYQKKIFALAFNPENPLFLLDFMSFLLYQGLGKEALAVFKRTLDIIKTSPYHQLTVHDSSMCHILSSKMSRRYFSFYERMDSIKFLIDSFPESPFVLSHCANTLYRTQYKQAAEQLVIGVLMLNPNYDHALRLYAHILIEQGQYRLAARYLHRIDSKSPLWSVTQLEIAWLIEINGAEADGAILAYKSCATNSNKNNYIISRAMHSIGITYHLLNDESNAFEYYRRSLLYDSDNCQSSVLFAAFGVANNLNNKFTQKSVGSNAQTYCLSNDEIDSQYRRGLIAMERCSYQWIPTLGYADFQAFVLQDYERAERYYNNANQLGSSLTVWPAIAYAHYYQYILGDLRRANNVMIRIMNARGLPLVDSPDFNVAPVYESKTVHSRIAQLVVDEELAALYVACAYIYLDWKEFEYAAKCTAKALQFSENYSPALRCISIITVTTSGDLQLAMRYLKLGITQCPNNPFILRIGSLINLKLYNYDLAISMMDSAVLNGLQFPLAHRCAGIMSYLFKCSTEKYDKVLYCLHKAYELSNGEDVDAARLKGQVLMEMGCLNEASGWFRSALRVVPWDPICLASLAVCLSLLKRASKSNKKSKDRRINRDKIRSKLSNLSDYGVLINSKDSDELFEASITGNLSTIVAKNLKKSRTNANSESTRNSDICDRSPNLNITYEESDNGLSNKVNSLDSYSIPPDVYVWYGVYELQKINSNSLVMLNPIPSYIHHFNEARPNSDFISDGLLKAKVLFEAASRRYQSVLNPLATFMIGWVIEIEGDLPLAEQYYNNALSCNPEKNILCYYRMIATLEKKYRAVKRLLAKHEKLSLNKAGSKNNKLQMKEKLSLDPFLAIFDPTTTNNFEDGYYPTQRIPRMLMDSDDESNDCNNNDSSRNIDHVRKRWLLHQRIYETAQLKKSHFKFLFKKFESFNLDDSSNKSSNCGNTAQNIGSNIYFYLEEDWVDRYLHAFGKCEDWAWLLRSCSTYPQQVSPIGLTSTNIKPVFSKRGIYQYKNDKNNSIGSSGSPKSNSNSKPGISTDTIGETIKIVNILSTTKLKTLEKVNKSEKKTSKKKKKKTKEM